MDGAAASMFPHLTWLGFRLVACPGRPQLALPLECVHHTVCLTVSGRQDVRRVTHGRETAWREEAGTVNFLPADGERHTFITRSSPDQDTAVFFIPSGQMRCGLGAEGAAWSGEGRQVLAPHDEVLRRCMTRLALPDTHDDRNAACRKDEAARRLLLRLAELSDGVLPDWHHDESTFEGRTIENLTAYIDTHLGTAPSLTDMGLITGLSPSHFARKFRRSTGVSLMRFVNRRRLQRALDTLQGDDTPLATVACDLGFSSQSHFTRLFSGLTGMTPAKYRKQGRGRKGGNELDTHTHTHTRNQ